MAGTYTAGTPTIEATGELADLLAIYADQRELLKVTARGLTDEQARQRTTVSELTIGGIIKHVAIGERDTAAQIVERDETAALDMAELADVYTFGPDDSIASWLDEFDTATAEFERVLAAVVSLDELIPQPTAPWAPEREWMSVRSMILHRLREIAHHSGHADIIREALDGQSTMAAISEGQDWADADWTQ